jgi:hypothetical protein
MAKLTEVAVFTLYTRNSGLQEFLELIEFMFVRLSICTIRIEFKFVMYRI